MRPTGYAAVVAADVPSFQCRGSGEFEYVSKGVAVPAPGVGVVAPTLVAVPGPTYAQDGNQGVHLNGGGYMPAAFPAQFGTRAAWTLEFWWMHRTADEDGQIGGGGPMFYTNGSASNIGMDLPGVGQFWLAGQLLEASEPPHDQWNHFIFSFDGVNALWLINGLVVASGPLLQTGPLPGALCIGGDAGPTWGWQGCFADISIYTHNLTHAQMIRHFAAAVIEQTTPDPSTFVGPHPLALLADGPAAYYRLDEPSGTWANDCSGNDAAAAYVGTSNILMGSSSPGVTYEKGGLLETDADAAIGFDGVTGGLLVPFWQFSGSAYTFEAIFFAVGDGALCSSGMSGDTGFVHLAVQNGQTQLFYQLGSNAGDMNGTVALVPGQKVHVVLSWDGKTGKLYLNGTLVASSPVPAITTQNTLAFGLEPDASGTVNFLNCVLDEVAIYNFALLASRVWIHWLTVNGLAPAAASGGIAGNDEHYYELRIYSPTGELLELPIDVVDLDLSRAINGGAQSNATITLQRPFNNIGPGPAFQNRVLFWFWNGRIARPVDPWWAGYILDIDQSKLKTDGKITLHCTGDMTLLDAAIVTETINPGIGGNPNLDAMDYFRYLMATYGPPGFGNVIAPDSAFNALPQQFSEQSLGSVIDTIVKQGRTDEGLLYIWTVQNHADLSRDLVFMPDQDPNVLTNVLFKHVFVEGGTSQYDLQTKYSGICNVVLVMGGQDSVTGTQISAVYEDAESMAQFGPIENSISVPELISYAAALLYGETYLNINGNPQAQGTVALTVPDPSIVEGTWIQFWEAPGVIKQMRSTTVEVKIAKGRITQTISPTAPTPYLDAAVYVLGQRVQQKAISQTKLLPVNYQTLYARTGGAVSPG